MSRDAPTFWIDIWRVAPAAYRDVAIRLGESFDRLPVRAANHFEARSRHVRKARRIERVDSLQISAELIHDLLLPLRGSIGELRTKGRSRAGVDSERCRAFGIEPQKVVANLIEQLNRIRLGRTGRRRIRRPPTASAITRNS